jgi:hypothetical protein
MTLYTTCKWYELSARVAGLGLWRIAGLLAAGDGDGLQHRLARLLCLTACLPAPLSPRAPLLAAFAPAIRVYW